MAGVRSIFDIAKGALTANQLALQTVSHNIANVDTPGYSRQQAVLQESMPLPSAVGLIGNGVKVTEVRRFINKFLEDTITNKNTDLEFQKTAQQYLQQIEGILNEDNSQLTANLTAFFNAWQDLSTDPAGVSQRVALEQQGENLASSIRTVYSDLRTLQKEINNTVAQEVDSINRITGTIAELNRRISESGTGGQANDYLDQRTELLKELSGKLDIISFEDSTHRISVMAANGKPLVDAYNHWNLKVSDPYSTGFYQINWEDSNGNLSDITTSVTNGTLGSLLRERDVDAQSFIDQLDALAKTVITQVNQIHETGYNLNQTSGLSFFEPLTQNYAADMDVSDEVKNDANNIASTSSLDRPTDNDITLAIAGLGEANLLFTVEGNTSATKPVDFVSSMLSRIGQMTKNAQDLVTYQNNTMTVLKQQRESVSGVSLDEELTNMIQYQRAYQAAAQLISVGDELLTTLLGVVRASNA